MLADHPIDPMILATDLGVAKEFYGERIGLEANLRSRGVALEEYDGPELKTVDGIADVGFALAAWIVDPHGNSIGLLQVKDAEMN
jgi:hypothetical protein